MQCKKKKSLGHFVISDNENDVEADLTNLLASLAVGRQLADGGGGDTDNRLERFVCCWRLVVRLSCTGIQFEFR